MIILLRWKSLFWGVTVEIDVTFAFAKAKVNHQSFFITYLHAITKAVNSVENLRLRINQNQEVELYESINASATIMRANETIGFSWIPYHNDFDTFNTSAKKEIERVQQSNSLFPPVNGRDCIHFSAIPWIPFKSLSQCRSYSINDSIPKISVGKVQDINNKKIMPLSIHVHHALADGLHVGKFFEQLELILQNDN